MFGYFKNYAAGGLGMFEQVRHWWQAKQSAWLQRRIAIGSHTLGKRSIFILPTRQGLYLAFFLLAMLVACINYNLSLGYMLTFFVFSVALAAMHRTHQNLLGMQIEACAGEPVFANAQSGLNVVLKNTSCLHKHAIHLALRPASRTAHSASAVGASLAAQSEQSLSLSLPLLPRGLHLLPALEISSSYPLGLWRAWSYAFPTGTVTVYPEPHTPLPPLLPLLQDRSIAAMVNSQTQDAQGDAVSHIEAVQAASARSIHWPAFAKGQLAQRVLENDAPTAQGVLLSLAHCTATGLEAKLSQLCAAVLQCQALSIPFVMQLHAQAYSASQQASCDVAHTQACLEALAAYE